MSRILIVFLTFLPTCLCTAGAIYLAANGIDGWSWFLIAAVLVGGSVSFGGHDGR